MTEIERFDPFNNRLCRNVRNALSEGFKTALDKGDMQPVVRIAGFFLDDAPPACVRDYIDNRRAADEQVLADVGSSDRYTPWPITVAVWDRRLFFETHEYLEIYWMAASGDEKLLFQAIIRAAGAYVHLEQGNLTGARRIADKALVVLERLQNRLAPHADPQLLIDKLRKLDPVPPSLGGTAMTGGRAKS